MKPSANSFKRSIRPKPLATATRAITASLLGLLLALPVIAVEVSPKVIEFRTMDAVETIQITHNGKALPASAIGAVKIYAGGHDYDEMIVVTKSDGLVSVRPSKLLEIGSYDLVIDTTEGKGAVSMMVPLDKLYTSLESRSARLGITVDELKARLGLTQRLGQEVIDLGIPKVYYLGQTLILPMTTTENRVQQWAVNGTLVETDTHGAPLKYTFTEKGTYDFSYVEKEGERIVATGFGATTVVPEPAVHLIVSMDTPLKLVAPEGYSHYVWAVDDVPASMDQELTQSFTTKGDHVATLHAHTPVEGTTELLRKITYLITVN